MVEYLKEENRILRDKLPRRLTVTLAGRNRLAKLGAKLGTALKGLITIVTPRTFARWLRGDKPAANRDPTRAKLGRPPTEAEIRQLVVKIAQETGWGYTRILGELKKLGVPKISRSTIVNILKANGLDPGPKRAEGTWADFLQRHAQTLWACDFLSKKIWTLGGLVDVFVLFFIHVGSRRVFLSGMTTQPDRAWMVQQARSFSLYCAEQGYTPKYLLRDMDSKFVAEFDAVLGSDSLTIKRVGPRAPNLNAYAERWVQSLKRECLDHFIVFGEEHLRYLVSQYVAHYHQERPHQSLGNRPLSHTSDPPVLPLEAGAVVCEERLGGLLKHYRRVG